MVHEVQRLLEIRLLVSPPDLESQRVLLIQLGRVDPMRQQVLFDPVPQWLLVDQECPLFHRVHGLR